MHNISLCSCFVSHHCQKGFWALRSGCLNNQLRFWGAQVGGSAGSHCHWAPQGQSSAPELLPLLRMFFSKLTQSSVASFPACVCPLLGFLQLQGSFAVQFPPDIQPCRKKDFICKPKCIPTLLCPSSTLSICLWVIICGEKFTF